MPCQQFRSSGTASLHCCSAKTRSHCVTHFGLQYYEHLYIYSLLIAPSCVRGQVLPPYYIPGMHNKYIDTTVLQVHGFGDVDLGLVLSRLRTRFDFLFSCNLPSACLVAAIPVTSTITPVSCRSQSSQWWDGTRRNIYVQAPWRTLPLMVAYDITIAIPASKTPTITLSIIIFRRMFLSGQREAHAINNICSNGIHNTIMNNNISQQLQQ